MKDLIEEVSKKVEALGAFPVRIELTVDFGHVSKRPKTVTGAVLWERAGADGPYRFGTHAIEGDDSRGILLLHGDYDLERHKAFEDLGKRKRR